ncbi:MAG: MAPEG family protein [Sandarakinorhabdus sp.]|nr:MAPEG family protein [Sandarakinorhabdus sp.]
MPGELGTHELSILRAVFGMGVLTLVMFIWMYATRLPAFSKAKLDPQEAMHPGTYHDRIPSEVRRVADNYNHLFEAPALFYAIALAVVVAGLADPLHAMCAWAYLGLRVAHSLVQATVNRVALRFVLFALSWVALGIMIVRAMLAMVGW